MIDALNQLHDDWRIINRVIPYGFGLDAKRTLKRIIKDFEVPFIIDADESKWGKKFYGITVKSPKYLSELQKNDKILITIAKRRYPEIKMVCEEFGLQENIDYCHISQFAVEWYLKYKNEYCLFTLDMALTTACTLKCKNCNMFIPYHTNPWMCSFKEFKDSIDILLERIDYIFTLGLLGGEAFLNPELPRILNYLYKQYRNRIGQVILTTNAVKMPSENILQSIIDNSVIIAISDYSHSIGKKSRINELSTLLEEKGISYSIMYNRQWCDFGFPRQIINISDEHIREHMMQCNPGWHGLNNGKLYFCNVAWSAEKTGLFKLQQSDKLDLTKLIPGEENSKKQVLDFIMGNLPKGFLSFCKVCAGCGPDNKNYVLAGEQIN